MVVQDWISPNSRFGAVFLGYGEADLFPGYLDVQIAPRLLGRTKAQSAGA